MIGACLPFGRNEMSVGRCGSPALTLIVDRRLATMPADLSSPPKAQTIASLATTPYTVFEPSRYYSVTVGATAHSYKGRVGGRRTASGRYHRAR